LARRGLGYDEDEIGRSVNSAPAASPSTIPPAADVAEPRAGSRHPVLGQWDWARVAPLPRIGGDPADVYPDGDLWGGCLL